MCRVTQHRSLLCVKQHDFLKALWEESQLVGWRTENKSEGLPEELGTAKPLYKGSTELNSGALGLCIQSSSS